MQLQTDLILWTDSEDEFRDYSQEYIINPDYYRVWPLTAEDILESDKIILKHLKSGSSVTICRKDKNHDFI